MSISQFAFLILLGTAVYFFAKSIGKIRRNIFLGKDQDLTDNKAARWRNMALMALGQKRMFDRPLAAVLHIFIYVGFILINLEVLEIFIDGALGTHRVFEPLLDEFYYFLIGFFEVLALGVLVACVAFLYRRYISKVPRLVHPDLEGFPVKDATLILCIEIVLMAAVLIMNITDVNLQNAAWLPVSMWFAPLVQNIDAETLHSIERFAWWSHLVGILLFLNYLPFSKHFHIITAFPNTWYANLNPKGKFENMASVQQEVALMMDPSAQPPEGYEPPTSFGVKDINDLSWKNLLDAYSCTECGRCTSVCPANITGKLLSPRRVVMQVRDRMEEVGQNFDKHGTDYSDGKDLHSYISAEELWACTTCNACVEACPVQINPMEVIYDMRQYLVMEKSEAPAELNGMFTNLENNGAPWQFSAMDRGNWAKEG
ncbi:MAG: 4Fe-4S dicluster domain-containing protein [Bacteroidia bacterium]